MSLEGGKGVRGGRDGREEGREEGGRGGEGPQYLNNNHVMYYVIT